jgi:hypothetical protein
MAKAVFIKKKALFTSTLDMVIEEEVSEVLHWSVALFSA